MTEKFFKTFGDAYVPVTYKNVMYKQTEIGFFLIREYEKSDDWKFSMMFFPTDNLSLQHYYAPDIESIEEKAMEIISYYEKKLEEMVSDDEEKENAIISDETGD